MRHNIERIPKRLPEGEAGLDAFDDLLMIHAVDVF
jgi:hypothetical protein